MLTFSRQVQYFINNLPNPCECNRKKTEKSQVRFVSNNVRLKE